MRYAGTFYGAMLKKAGLENKMTFRISSLLNRTKQSRFLVMITLVTLPVMVLGAASWAASETSGQSLPELTYAEMIHESRQLEREDMNAEYNVFWLTKTVTILDELKYLQDEINDTHDAAARNSLQSRRDTLLKDDILVSENLSYRVDDHQTSSLNSSNDIALSLKLHREWLDNAKKSQATCSEQLEALTKQIDDYLNREAPDQMFKRTISEYFTALVGIVIAGFFAISFKDPAVGREIFSGEAGLQFVTLFAVVIAIILFGVVGILDGKELAALLGGLSGYILGRTGAGSAHAESR